MSEMGPNDATGVVWALVTFFLLLFIIYCTNTILIVGRPDPRVRPPGPSAPKIGGDLR